MAHIHEKIDWCAGVYIVHKNRVLLRLHDKYKIWIHVGGHIELDEDPVTAAKRECMEEVGLDVRIYGEEEVQPLIGERGTSLPRPAHMNIHYVADTDHQHIDLIYYGTSETMEVVPENKDDEWRWLTREEVLTHPDMRPKIRGYALGALDALST